MKRVRAAFNAALMFIGPFSVYLGGLLGARRVLLACASVFTLISLLLPFARSLPVILVLLVLAGLTAGTSYPLTLSFVLRNLPMRYVLVGIAIQAVLVDAYYAFAWCSPPPIDLRHGGEWDESEAKVRNFAARSGATVLICPHCSRPRKRSRQR
jgi:hypothetical protein